MEKKEGRYKVDRGEICRHGLYARLDLHRIDGRSRLGQMIKALKRQLEEFVGEENLTPAVEILIDEIAYKCIRLQLYKSANLTNPEHKEAHHYVSLSNSLRQDLVALTQITGKAKAPSLEDFIREFQ